MSDTQPPPDLLIIDDDENIRNLLGMAARSRGWRPVSCGSGGEGVRTLNELRQHIKAIVLDHGLPDGDGISFIAALHAVRPEVPVVMLTGLDHAETAIRAVRAGADDYITKPFDLERLFGVIQEACRSRSQGPAGMDEKPVLAAKSESAAGSPQSVLSSKSPRMMELLRQMEKAGKLDITVLLTGESGTGKTRVAREIHHFSPRASEAFIPVSCPALPRELLESELFGHEKGAFTGATAARAGRFEQASKGTIFLDEIGDLPAELQPKLLTVLQDREFFRVGGSKILRTEARVIAATNMDLAGQVASGAFREDLSYRLNSVELRLPALRERREDIEDLAISLVARIATRRGEQGWKLTRGAIEAMRSFDWPGNIRQLENVLERATAFTENKQLDESDIVPLLGTAGTSAAPANGPGPGRIRTLQEAEREAFLLAYRRCGGNKAQTARELGVSERTVYNLIARYEIN